MRSSGTRALRATEHAVAVLLMALMTTISVNAAAASGEPGAAAALLANYAALKKELDHNQFHRPLHMRSSEASGGVTGEIHALVDYPFAATAAALSKPSRWCDILILHLNTKYCRALSDNRAAVLHVGIGKKHDQPMEEAYRLDFVYQVAAERENYLKVKLEAESGPLSTYDYSIVLEATAAAGGQTFIRLTYSYSYGMVGRLAMEVYLGTIGRDKVGFTVAGRSADGEPLYIGGIRGVVERNTMRYYLAIDAFLGALSSPPQARMEKSLRDWFAASETYPRQLHEMEKSDYLDMKRREYARQQS